MQARWFEKTVRYAKKHFSDEIIFCPNGDVYQRHEIGAEFLLPVDRIDYFKVGISGFDKIERSLLSSNVQPQDQVLDIGANMGIHSILLAKSVPGVQVYALEPVAANFDVLRKNITRNNVEQQVHAFQSAVGADDRMVHMPAHFGTDNYVIYNGRKRRDASALHEVRQVSLDSFIRETSLERLTCIKCDVEGYEWQVIQGAKQCLSRFRPLILIELIEMRMSNFRHNPEEVYMLLRSLGYNYIFISNTQEIKHSSGNFTLDLKQASSNFLFFPQEKKIRGIA
jgi:FkbM family methyltransferase